MRKNNSSLHCPGISICCQGIFPPALSCLHLITLGWSAYLLFQPQPLLLSRCYGTVNVSVHPMDRLPPCYLPAPVLEAWQVWISIWMETHDKMSWILNLDTLLFPGLSLLRAPRSAMLLCPFSPFLPLLNTDASRANIFLPRDICPSTYSHVTFHPLTSVAGIPRVRKPEMFPWLLRFGLAKQQGEGSEGPSFPDPPECC